MKITHVIAGLSMGGAQMMLYKLLSRMDRNAFAPEVISLADVGPLDKKIRALGVSVRVLGMRAGVPNPLGVYRLARWFRHDPPQVVQTWMYHADLIGGLAAKLAGGIPVAWNIRHSTLAGTDDKRTTVLTVKACARLSGCLPLRVVCCSEASRRVHSAFGYQAGKMVVIPNGFDLAAFKPEAAARRSVRRELGLQDDALLIGLVGRFNAQKDHKTFVEAAARLCADVPDTNFVLCGDDVTPANTELVGWMTTRGIRERCHLLGRREDMPRLTAALDIATTTSAYGEGFPNVIGEAMACGVPCVATDVGDAGLIIGDTGKLAPPRHPDAVSEAWRALISLGRAGRAQLGSAARRRVEKNFSLPSVVERYQSLYEELAMGKKALRLKPLSPQSRRLAG
jgi:glycosyltransferase involved in cell wall biosynthesis